jgi:glycosyltransferase involved in cell wall biosynthesis
MKIVIIFDNIGPYHNARLCSAAKVGELIALQVKARSTEYAWNDEVRPEGFKVVTLFSAGSNPDEKKRELVQRMNSALDECGPQAVFVPGWYFPAALAALSWCSMRNVPAILMSESTAWDEKRQWWKEWIKQRLLSLYSGALVGGTPQRDYVVQLGMSVDRVRPGYDAVDNEYFRQSAKKIRAQTLESDGREVSSSNYFLASARFIEKKNLSRLLQAYALYREQNTAPWSLVLLGDGPLRDSLRSRISSLNLQGHVRLPGFIQYSDLPAHYALAGAFIHASTTEQWGLVVNEAMASSLPVLVSNRCGCATDLVEDGRNGFTFDPFNINDLAGLMKRISSMETEARKAMGGESGKIVAEWGPERFADGIRRLTKKSLIATVPKPKWFSQLILRGLLLR